MSRPTRRRAAVAAAVLGVLMALTSSLGITAVADAAVPSVGPGAPSPASFADASGTLDLAAVRTTHSSTLGSAGSHRSHGGPAFAPAALGGSLLLLAALCLVVAVRRTTAHASWRSPGAAGPRAPPAPVAC